MEKKTAEVQHAQSAKTQLDSQKPLWERENPAFQSNVLFLAVCAKKACEIF